MQSSPLSISWTCLSSQTEILYPLNNDSPFLSPPSASVNHHSTFCLHDFDYSIPHIMAFLAGSIPGSGRSPGEGSGNPLQYSCLANSMDRGAWWATVHGVAKSRLTATRFCFPSLYWLFYYKEYNLGTVNEKTYRVRSGRAEFLCPVPMEWDHVTFLGH